MKRYSVEELIWINEFFENAVFIQISLFNKFVKIDMTDEEGNTEVRIVTKRDFRLIQKNFFVEEIHEIIELLLNNKNKCSIFTDYNEKEFPVSIKIFDSNDNLIKAVRCSDEEFCFIYNAVKKQKCIT